jgi:putative MATE family efflux protein
MLTNKRNDALLAKIRDGLPLNGNEKLNLIIGLSIPSILAQITSVLMFFIDASMVGSLGADPSAAIGLMEPAGWLFGSLGSAAGVGFSVQVAHFVGANDFKKARQVMRHGYIFCLVFSLALMAVAAGISPRLPHWLGGGESICHDASVYFFIYAIGAPFFVIESLTSGMLKASGDMRSPSAVAMLACVLDVVFNFLLIFPTRHIHLLGLDILMPGAGLRVAGAALGTTLAYALTVFILLYITLFRSAILAIRHAKERMEWHWGYIRRAVKISAPMALQYVLMNGAQVVSTIIVAPLGNIAIASNSFAITAESLCYMPGYGIGDAATTLVGQSIGAGRKDICRSFAHLTIFLGMGIMAFMGAVMWVFAPELMSLLSPVTDIRELGTAVLRIEAWAEPFFAASIVGYSVCVGAGDTLKPAIMNLCSMWGVRLTLAFGLSKVYGLRGVWFAMATELTFRGCMFLYRIFRGKWMNTMR